MKRMKKILFSVVTMFTLLFVMQFAVNAEVFNSRLNISKFDVEISGSTLRASVQRPVYGSCVEYELTDLTNQKKTVKSITSSCSTYYSRSITQNKPYAFRARAYKMENGKKYVGNWTGYKYVVSPIVSGRSVSNKAGFTINLRKAAGIKSYSVYISPNPNSGYKKAATITASKAKSKRITKCGSARLRRSTRYYVKVFANIKVGKKTVMSNTYFRGSIYNFK